MDHNTTMPSLLGPESGYDRANVDRRQTPDARKASLVVKAIVWAAFGLVVFGAYRFLIR